MKIRSAALLLAVLQLVFVLAACNTDTNTPADTTASPVTGETTAPVETEEPTEAEKRAMVDDELPDGLDFGGRDFTIITLDGRLELYDADAQTGVTLNDAIYARNNTVESDYGVKIGTITYPDFYACRAAVNQALTSGDTEMFDLVSYHMVDNGSNAIAGHYLDWYEVPYVDFEKPWWSDSNIEDLTVNGKCFIAIGDVNITSIRNTWCYILNKEMARDAGVGDLYQLVRDKKWTIDKVREIAETVYRDVNADGQQNLGDTFGLGSYVGSGLNAYLWAFDNPIIKKDESGTPQFVLNTDKFPDIVTTVVELYTSAKGVYACTGNDSTSYHEAFVNGQILMVTGGFMNLTNELAVAEFECGVLPYPLFDENQTEYYTMVDGGGDSMGISKIESPEDVEFIGLITEALCAESYKQIYPVYYDSMLKNRYADMPDDAEMMDILVNGRVYDLGYIYDNFMGASFWMQTLARERNTNVSSYYASNWPKAKAHYTRVLRLFED